MEFKQLIKDRRSVRKYEEGRTISKELMEEIITETLLAPTWKNSETGRYYVAITPEKIAQVRDCLPDFNQKSTADAAGYIVTAYVKDTAGFTKKEADNELGNKWGTYDLGLQNSYLLLSARNHGLDTLIMGLRDSKKLAEVFDVPEDEEIVSVIAIGYRDGEPAVRPRKTAADVAKIC